MKGLGKVIKEFLLEDDLDILIIQVDNESQDVFNMLSRIGGKKNGEFWAFTRKSIENHFSGDIIDAKEIERWYIASAERIRS